MLKIKDNVDLTELEKFGFQNDPYSGYLRCLQDDDYIWINKNTYVIDFGSNGHLSYETYSSKAKRLLKKLKNAGLVEKVEEL